MDVLTFVHHSPVHGHLACFQLLAITNEVALNICVQVIACAKLSFLLGIYLGAKMLGLYSRYLFNFSGKRQTVFQSDLPLYIPTSSGEEFSCSTSPPTLEMVSLLKFSRSSRCTVVSGGLNMHVSNNY